MPAHAERGTEVAGERPDVRAGRHGHGDVHVQGGGRVVGRLPRPHRAHVEDLEARDDDGPCRERDVLARASPGVGPLPVDLDRAHRARHLQDLAREVGDPAVEVRAPDPRRVGARDDLALGVVGRRGGAQPDRRVVVLVRAHDVREQLGRPTDPEHEHARRHGVERARVPDLARAGEPAPATDDVVARPAARLVDDDQTVGRRRPPRRAVARARGACGGHRGALDPARPGASDGWTVHRTSAASTGSSSARDGAWTANRVLSSIPCATKSRASSSLAPERVR